MAKKTTIRDVAKACGYSVYTVSAVMNNKRGVSEQAREIVRQAILDLDYNPLDNLPGTHRIRHKALGIVVPSTFSESNPFFQRAVAMVRSMSSVRDYDCKLFTEEDLVRRLDTEGVGPGLFGVEGLIVFCPILSWEDYVDKVLDRGLPVALVRRRFPERPGLLVVTDDDREGMMRAMEHLHQVHQHRCIGFCGFYTADPIRNPRFPACLEYMNLHGLKLEPGLVLDAENCKERNNGEILSWVKRCRKDSGMSAVMCWTDDVAARLVKILLQAGLRVPEDLAVVGVNNDSTASIFHPGITSVHVPVEEMVTAGCRYLLDYSPKTPPPVQTRFHQSLVVRDSCGSH